MGRSICVAVIGLSLLTAAANAGIVVDLQVPESSAVVVSEWNWDQVAQHLQLTEQVYDRPATINVAFMTDEERDPSVWIIKRVENDTTFAWTGYTVEIGLDRLFQIDGASAPTGWDYTITQPVLIGSNYVGTVSYEYGGPGTEINVGDWADFGVGVSFEGDVNFCINQVPVPEPGSLLLMASAAMIAVGRMRSRA